MQSEVNCQQASTQVTELCLTSSHPALKFHVSFQDCLEPSMCLRDEPSGFWLLWLHQVHTRAAVALTPTAHLIQENQPECYIQDIYPSSTFWFINHLSPISGSSGHMSRQYV